MRILVTGRDGQLARSLRDVAASNPAFDLSFASRPEVDLSITGSLGAAILKARPDVVINAAAYTAVDAAEDRQQLAYRVNAEAAGEGAHAAAEIGARFIQLSTDYVFDGELGRPYREDDPTAPLNVYGRTKLAGEVAVRTAHVTATVVRTGWVVSPYGHNFAKTMLKLAHDKDAISVVDDQRGRPTSALDLADGLLKMADMQGAEGATVHFTNAGEASWAELAAHVMQCAKEKGAKAAAIKPIPSSGYPTAARRPRDARLDCDFAEKQLQLHRLDWRASIKRIVDTLIENAEA